MALKIYKKGAYVVINNGGKLTELNSAEVSITKDTEAIDIYEVKHNGVSVLKAQLSDILDESGVAYVEAVWDAFRYEQTGTTNTGTGVTSAAGVTYDPTASGLAATTAQAAIDEIAPTYKVYSALLTQSGTGAPVATIMQNTIGSAITWSRASAGNYIATATGLLTSLKTTIFTGQDYLSAGDITYCYPDDNNNTATIETLNNAGASTDGILIRTFVEIRVYA